MKSISRIVSANCVSSVAAVLLLAVVTAHSAPSHVAVASSDVQFAGFPDADARSGRFINVTRGLSSLGDAVGSPVGVQLAVPESAGQLELRIFDGDMGGRWDPTSPPGATPDQLTYRLYRDPLGAGNTDPTELLASWASSQMPDDDWWQVVVSHDPGARTAAGGYGYHLAVTWNQPQLANEQNNFKVAVRGLAYVRAGSTVGIIGYGPLDPLPDTYPPTNYDGSVKLRLALAEPASLLEVWEGDLDRWDDTDDLESPPFPPFTYSPYAVAEGARLGRPADDASASSPLLHTPSVFYTIQPPAEEALQWTVANSEPSGDREWEVFRIGVDGVAGVDATVPELPAGAYRWQIVGLDGRNTVFLNAASDLWGEPPSELGDRVWFDADADGLQDASEPGIPGVEIELWADVNGDGTPDTLHATTTTDAQGNYLFESLVGGDYIVRISASETDAGGTLASLTVSPANIGAAEDVDSNGTVGADGVVAAGVVSVGSGASVRTVDFGFYGSGSLGDFVWFDANGNGLQDDLATSGLGNVVLELRWDSDGDGAVDTLLATTVTSGDGFYRFDRLPAGLLEVRVQPTTLPGGLVPSYDLDGTSSANVAQATLAFGEDRSDVDFGYWVQLIGSSGALGDLVWWDMDGDGIQDAGEPGIDGVVVNLFGDLDGDGDVELQRTTTTQSIAGVSGLYGFSELPAGVYTIAIDGTSLATGGVLADYIPTTQNVGTGDAVDSDGNPTSYDVAGIQLPAGGVDDSIDFGFRVVRGGQGCTPGYWKQKQHFDSWMVYKPTNPGASRYDAVFGVPYAKTLLEALGTGGGGEKALGRHASAALLNAVNPNVSYRYTVAEVIQVVQNAYETGQFEAAHQLLAAENESGCPLN